MKGTDNKGRKGTGVEGRGEEGEGQTEGNGRGGKGNKGKGTVKGLQPPKFGTLSSPLLMARCCTSRKCQSNNSAG
jgi:hypothetical protein